MRAHTLARFAVWTGEHAHSLLVCTDQLRNALSAGCVRNQQLASQPATAAAAITKSAATAATTAAKATEPTAPPCFTASVQQSSYATAFATSATTLTVSITLASDAISTSSSAYCCLRIDSAH